MSEKRKDGVIQKWGHGTGDQFDAQMAIESGSPYSLFAQADKEQNVCFVIQNRGKTFIAFQHAQAMRKAAEMLLIMADQWDSGELGLK